ncbi:MAG: tRNA (guanosine(46)-N7)-methyltransferase TrmB [Tepidisphaera sp.]|nr:tRNA (guanosine(46)-N7)-methyltransferase TrmB [Tepidisphaera sp.]
MSFGLGHGRTLDDAPGVVGVSPAELPALPDEAMTNPSLGHIDPRGWFKEPSAPFELEIGCGKGSFMLQEAAANPSTNYLGIEWAREFYLYAADRVRRRALPNVRMLHTDATEFLKWRCPGEIIRVIHLYYSDPWPKARHHKNRVVQDAFLAQVYRVLAPGGELRVVTDHVELWAWCEEHFARWTDGARAAEVLPHLEKALGGSARRADLPRPPFERRGFEAPTWADDDELIGTNYEKKTRAAGRPPNACVLVKR